MAGSFDVAADLACVILSKIHDVPTRAALMCVSRVWREAGKEKTSFPSELDFTTVPNLEKATIEDMEEFMERIEGIHIRLPPGSEWPYKKLHDGVALDRMRLTGTTVAAWDLHLLDFYVKHDRKKVKTFDEGPFDVWGCMDGAFVCEELLCGRGVGVCVICEVTDTNVMCEYCAEQAYGVEICECCRAWTCGHHSSDEMDGLMAASCYRCEWYIRCRACHENGALKKGGVCAECDAEFCSGCSLVIMCDDCNVCGACKANHRLCKPRRWGLRLRLTTVEGS